MEQALLEMGAVRDCSTYFYTRPNTTILPQNILKSWSDSGLC